MKVNGTIFVDPGEDGVVNLHNVNATEVKVLSGATDSIHLKDSTIVNLIMNDINNQVRVVVEGTTTVTKTSVQSGGKLELENTTASFGNVELAPSKSDVDIELLGLEEINVTSKARIVSSTKIKMKIQKDVEVILKENKNDPGLNLVGSGKDEAVEIDTNAVKSVLNKLTDNMLEDIVYPGDNKEGDPKYTLATFVLEEVKKIALGETDKGINLSVGNKNVEYGKYLVTLNIGSAISTKEIIVDTITVDTAKAFEDVLRYNIKNIKIAKDITISQETKKLADEKGLLIDQTKGKLTVEGSSEPIEKDILDIAIKALQAKDIEIEDKSIAFKEDGKSGVVDITKEDIEEAIKSIINNDKINVEVSSVANAKKQTVTLISGEAREEVNVNLTVVPNKSNTKTLSFSGDLKDLKVIIYEAGKNTRYTLEELKNHSDSSIGSLAEKITVEDNTITIKDKLLTTEQWNSIKSKDNSKILRAYRITILDGNNKIGKIAMYENGQAVIESK